jgi:hypothetical protein
LLLSVFGSSFRERRQSQAVQSGEEESEAERERGRERKRGGEKVFFDQ